MHSELFKMFEFKEKIRAAALKFKSGKIYTGSCHADAHGLVEEAILLESDMQKFARKLRDSMQQRMNTSRRSDYTKGDNLYTATGTRVTFIGDALSDKKTGERYVFVRNPATGEESRMPLKWVSVDIPNKYDALAFIKERYGNDRKGFEEAAKRRGFSADEIEATYLDLNAIADEGLPSPSPKSEMMGFENPGFDANRVGSGTDEVAQHLASLVQAGDKAGFEAIMKTLAPFRAGGVYLKLVRLVPEPELMAFLGAQAGQAAAGML